MFGEGRLLSFVARRIIAMIDWRGCEGNDGKLNGI